MNKNEREILEGIRNLLDSLLAVKEEVVNGVADEVDAYLMKKTTQESPEWRGRANCT